MHLLTTRARYQLVKLKYCKRLISSSWCLIDFYTIRFKILFSTSSTWSIVLFSILCLHGGIYFVKYDFFLYFDFCFWIEKSWTHLFTFSWAVELEEWYHSPIRELLQRKPKRCSWKNQSTRISHFSTFIFIFPTIQIKIKWIRETFTKAIRLWRQKYWHFHDQLKSIKRLVRPRIVYTARLSVVKPIWGHNFNLVNQ